MTHGEDNQIGAVENSCRILRALKELDGAGVTELSEELGLSKSTVHGHLATLYAQEHVVKRGNTYHLGLGLLELGGYVRDGSRLYQLARESVTELAENTGELAVAAVEEHGRCVYLYKATGSKAVAIGAHVGMRVPMHCTATGKSILAHLPDERTEKILDHHGLQRETEKTITDRETLYNELRTVTEQGYAFDNEERISGMRGIAAPVRHEETNEVLGTVAITGPTSRIAGDYFWTELPEVVKRAARVVEINATYS